MTGVVVYPKERPVSPLTARVTISYPAFFPRRMGGVGGCLTTLSHHHPLVGVLGLMGVSLGWSITPWGEDWFPMEGGNVVCPPGVGMGRCLTRLGNQPPGVGGWIPQG